MYKEGNCVLGVLKRNSILVSLKEDYEGINEIFIEKSHIKIYSLDYAFDVVSVLFFPSKQMENKTLDLDINKDLDNLDKEAYLQFVTKDDKIVSCHQKQCIITPIYEVKGISLQSEMNFPHSEGAAVVELDDSIWVTGGPHKHTDILHKGQWIPGPDLPVAMNHHSAVKLVEDKVLFVDGVNGKAFVYDASFQRWEKVKGTRQGKSSHLICGRNSSLVICLGKNGDVEIFDLDNSIYWDLYENSLGFTFSRGIFHGKAEAFILLDTNEKKYVSLTVANIMRSDRVIEWKKEYVESKVKEESLNKQGKLLIINIKMIENTQN